MTIEARLADGTVLRFPDGTPQDVVQATVKRQISSQQQPGVAQDGISRLPEPLPTDLPSPTQQPRLASERFGPGAVRTQTGAGVIEPALAIATGVPATIASGVAGIAALPFVGAESGDIVRRVQEALTFQPRTPEGQATIQSIASALEPITEQIEGARKAVGERGFEIAGPVGGAIGETLVEAGLMVAGGILPKGAGALRRIAKARPTPEQAAVLQAGKELNTPVLTTDILPPDSFAGKSLQQLSEKLGPLGTGPKRAAQQRARSDIVVELADEFNADLDAPFEADIVKSLKTKNAAELAKASTQRNSAVEALTPLGDVPTPKTKVAIQRQLDRQARLREKADPAQIDNLNRIRDSIDGNDFSVVKDIRQEVISDLKALRRGDDRRAEGALQSVKSAIDKDMVTFARKNDKQATKDWLASNRKFAFELSNARNTELKRIIETGDITPEKVGPILKGGKISELQRLNKSLTPKGKEAAKAAIIRNALSDSGFFTSPNPDRLATTLLKPNNQKAIKIFFKGDDKKRVEGLSRLLDTTRRAQQAALATPTGQALIPLAIGGGAVAEPVTTLLTAGTLSAVARAYESAPVRNLLIKIANSKPRSVREQNLTRSIGAAIAASVPVQQEQQ